jgi:hypothetical protein
MGAMIGFAVGYMLGTRKGEAGTDELKKAWATIRTSEEARDLVARGLAGAKYLLQAGAGMVASRLQDDSSGGGLISALRPTG